MAVTNYIWDMVSDSGNVKTRGFCPACGSPNPWVRQMSFSRQCSKYTLPASVSPSLRVVRCSICTPRLESSSSTFRLMEGEPLPTSYGEDSYRRVFETSP
jgi:hypothetical protein